jgi:hypothetical protein
MTGQVRSSVALLLIAGFGCARVPQEAVDLSAVVSRDLGEAHRANREIASRYFQRMRDDIDGFVDDVYRPYALRESMERFRLVERIQNAGQGDDGLDALDIMETYVDVAVRRIDGYRNELLAPVEAQEREALEGIDVAFQRMINANAMVTAHLVSVRKVQEVHDELLAGAGAPGLADSVATRLAAFSNALDDVLADARKVEASVDRGAVKAALDSLPDRVRNLNH